LIVLNSCMSRVAYECPVWCWNPPLTVPLIIKKKLLLLTVLVTTDTASEMTSRRTHKATLDIPGQYTGVGITEEKLTVTSVL